MKHKIFFPSLDGLRFFSFFSVFLAHSFYTDIEFLKGNSIYKFIKIAIFNNGELGVSFFFVLSGFLITYLLLKEKEFNGKIDIKKFYMRRILRIWPLFYLCVLFGFLIFPVLKMGFGQVPKETAHPLYYLFFLNNFDFIKHGSDASVLSNLWSIAVEEQFYLLWPLVLTFVPKRRYGVLFIIFIGISISFRALNLGNPNPLYLSHHTLSVFSDLAIGGLAALLVLNNNSFFAKVENMNSKIISLLYLAIFIILFLNPLIFQHPIMLVFKRVIVATFFAFLILEQNFSINSFFKAARLKLISNLGKYTYGLYCFHAIAILITYSLSNMFHFNTGLTSVILTNIVLSFLITILMGLLSYKFFESKFIKLKLKFSYIVK